MNTPSSLNRRLPSPIRSIINDSVARAIAVLVIIDIGLWAAWSFSRVSGWPELIVNSLQQLAIVLFITAFITGVFERIVSRRLGEKITEHTSEEARKIAERTSEETKQLSQEINHILKATYDSGIIQIFPKRTSGVEDIQKALREAKEKEIVRVAGVALPEFFDKSGGEFFEEICDLLQRGVEVRALLLDPESEAAEERNQRERFYRLVEHIRKSIGVIEEFKEEGWDIEPRCYNHRPIMFMICTDRYLFIEQYHCAEPPEMSRRKHSAGMVPLFQYGRESATYRTMRDHFDFVWDNP